MTTRVGARRAVALTLTALACLAVPACSSGSGPDSAGDKQEKVVRSTPTPASRYVVFPGDVPATGWKLSEAHKSDTDNRTSQLGELPGVDWYAEFEQPDTESEDVPYLSLTGYTQPLEQLRAAIPQTAQLSEGDIAGHHAFWGSDPADPEVGSFVTMDFGDGYSIELFATYVELDDLLTWAGSLRPASEAEWVAAGGVVATCTPLQDECG